MLSKLFLPQYYNLASDYFDLRYKDMLYFFDHPNELQKTAVFDPKRLQFLVNLKVDQPVHLQDIKDFDKVLSHLLCLSYANAVDHSYNKIDNHLNKEVLRNFYCRGFVAGIFIHDSQAANRPTAQYAMAENLSKIEENIHVAALGAAKIFKNTLTDIVHLSARDAQLYLIKKSYAAIEVN